MDENPKAGTKVTWKSHGGEAHGKVVKKVTRPTHIKGHKVAASRDDRNSSSRRRMASARRTRRRP